MPLSRRVFLLCLFELVVLSPRLADAQALVWTIDPGHSAAQFSVRHMVVSNVKGEFDGPAGTATFDAKDPTTLRVEATIDARTINTRNTDRDKDLRGTMFFDVAKYPRITFKSRSVTVVAPGKLKVAGDLTMHGVTRAVVLDVDGPTPEIKDIWGTMRIGATASTTVDRREYGLVYNSLLEAGGAVVGDQVAISIDLELTRNATAPRPRVPGLKTPAPGSEDPGLHDLGPGSSDPATGPVHFSKE